MCVCVFAHSGIGVCIFFVSLSPGIQPMCNRIKGLIKMKDMKYWKRDFTYDNNLFTSLSSFSFIIIICGYCCFRLDTWYVILQVVDVVIQFLWILFWFFSFSLLYSILCGIHSVCVSIKFRLWQSMRIVHPVPFVFLFVFCSSLVISNPHCSAISHRFVENILSAYARDEYATITR